MAKDFQANLSLSGKYMAVSGEAQATYAVTKTFSSNRSYAFFSYNAKNFNARLSDYGDDINVKTIEPILKKVPEKFNEKEESCVDLYRRFFRTLGTHVVTSAIYGGRFQMVSTQSYVLSSRARLPHP